MDQRPATTEELKELFGDGFSEEYQAEAQERWGESDAWKQSSAAHQALHHGRLGARSRPRGMP